MEVFRRALSNASLSDMVAMSQPFYIGRRLSYEGQLCTVRFIGEVKGTRGEWLGVEWDDPTRGKHNGEHEGIVYFQCLSNAKTAASFVRPTRKFDEPRSFVEALTSKYASSAHQSVKIDDTSNGAPNPVAVLEKVTKISGKVAEEIGFDKIRKRQADLSELRIVILDSLNIQRQLTDLYRRAWDTQIATGSALCTPSHTGRPLDVKQACPHVIELDVSRNMFEEWVEVASICEELVELHSLRCDGNRFRSVTMSEPQVHYFSSIFQNIDYLSLADTLLSWEGLATAATLFASINTFVASGNQLRCLGDSLLPSSITKLVLENNDFESLLDLSAISKLPLLRKLVLRNNFISSISPLSIPAPMFQSSLQDLDVSRNSIKSWAFINGLHTAFPGLTSLRISSNPLFTDLLSPTGKPLSADDGYTLTIARLPRLTSLNYSAVTPKDRLNAETYYLSQIALELSLSTQSTPTQQLLSAHPRWAELCDEYGAPIIPRTSGASDANALSARLIKLRLSIAASALPHINEGILSDSSSEVDGITVTVPKRYSIYTVQGLVGRRLGLSPQRVRLVWETGEPDVVVMQEETSFDPWDSDEDDDEEEGRKLTPEHGLGVKLREVQLIAGTRPISTWVDGDDVSIRVELAQ